MILQTQFPQWMDKIQSLYIMQPLCILQQQYPQTNNSMSVNYKSLNECTKEYKFEKNQVTNTIDLKLIDSCGNFSSCSIRTKQICNSKKVVIANKFYLKVSALLLIKLFVQRLCLINPMKFVIAHQV